ncbi:hypothetical protein PIB30_102194 [Stylosanthes scabra]|uniref:Uncharacterized protein n=1 Tax=Stylosanthes scabra TaxID=79078 RepID=A0ABU6RY45_9FABA|nr:hypothetical protein [Stylosanthes scabra]
MSVRPGKYRKIFALYEDSFHNFKGRYFKIFPVGNHRPFWLSLEGDGRFPPYWSDQAGFEIVPATYQRLNADQRDTSDILVHLFAQNNLNPKFLMNSSDEARRAVVEMAGNDVTLARLRRLLRPAPAKSIPSPSTAVPLCGARSVPAESAGKTQVDPECGSSTNVEHAGEQHVEVSSPGEEEIPLPPPPSPKRRRAGVEDASGSKRSRTLEGGSRDFCALDRSFDASGFVESHLLGPKAQEVLRDCDPLESVRWAEWAMIRAATIMKSVEPRLSIAEEVERRNARLLADAKTLNLQKMVLEEEKGDEVRARLRQSWKSWGVRSRPRQIVSVVERRGSGPRWRGSGDWPWRRRSGPISPRHLRWVFNNNVRTWPRMPRRLLLPPRVPSRPSLPFFFPTLMSTRSISSRIL